MKITNLSCNYEIAFSAGLTGRLLRSSKNIPASIVESILKEKYQINANFEKNDALAYSNLLCADVFKNIYDNNPTTHKYFPNSITTYQLENLLKKKTAYNFCITQDGSVLKGKNSFKKGDLFFLDSYDSLIVQNDICEKLFSQKMASSKHFLSSIVHEWIHSIHLNNIKILDNSKKTEQVFSTTPLKKNSTLISTNLSNYATISPFEFVAEYYTKVICNSLDSFCKLKDELFINNINSTPCIIKNLLKTFQAPTFTNTNRTLQ